jgi:hypothetical protein
MPFIAFLVSRRFAIFFFYSKLINSLVSKINDIRNRSVAVGQAALPSATKENKHQHSKRDYRE